MLTIKSFGETRETRVKVYEDDILYWNETKRDQFKGNQFLVQYDNGGTLNDANGTITEHTSESLEHILTEDKHGELPTYEPLYYSRKEPSSWYGITSQVSHFDSSQTIKFNISVSDTPEDQSISIPELPLYSVKSMKMASANGCSRHHGHFEETGNTCYIYSILSHICVQVDEDQGGKW